MAEWLIAGLVLILLGAGLYIYREGRRSGGYQVNNDALKQHAEAADDAKQTREESERLSKDELLSDLADLSKLRTPRRD